MFGHKIPYTDFKNYQVFQQMIMLGFLSEHAKITVSVGKKRLSKKILSLVHVDKIQFRKESPIDVEKIIIERCELMKEEEKENGLLRQTAERRFHKNKIVEMLHFLMDMLFLMGYDFDTYETKGRNGVLKQETIKSIILPNNTYLNHERIALLGSDIFDYIMPKAIANDSFVISGNDEHLRQLILPYTQKGMLQSLLLPVIPERKVISKKVKANAHKKTVIHMKSGTQLTSINNLTDVASVVALQIKR